MPPRAVVDNNLAVSFLLTSGPTIRTVFERWDDRRFMYVTSGRTLAELREVVGRPRLRTQLRVDPQALLESLTIDAVVIAGNLVVEGVCRDPKDDMLLACTVEGRADYLVSVDKDLFDLHEFRGVPHRESAGVRGVAGRQS